MSNTVKFTIAITALALSFGLGYYATPTKETIKTVVKVEAAKTEVKTRVVYRNKVTLPDGTITEKEEEREDSRIHEEYKSIATAEKVTVKDLGLVVSVMSIVPMKDLGADREYGVNVSKRVFGALTINGMVTTDRRIGAGLGWSF